MRTKPAHKHISTNNSLAAHLGGGRGSQGGAQQGTRARGEQYLDGLARSHTIAALELFVLTNIPNTETVKNTPYRVSVFSKQAHPLLQRRRGRRPGDN